MSRLTDVIAKAKSRVAREIEDDGEEAVKKGPHDAMHHHALHARAAEEAANAQPWGSVGREKAEEHAGKHAHTMMRHALENAKGRKGAHGVRHAMTSAADYFTNEAYGHEPEGHKKRVEHFKNGGDFVAHKCDKFGE